MTLEEMILKAVPVNDRCAIEEQYNKLRRKTLKERFEQHVSEQLSQQFNARDITENSNGMVSKGD